ncbi:MAG: YHS domain-containing protein [Cryomorphaceae bacterium]|jgi:YHS domain-containing protein
MRYRQSLSALLLGSVLILSLTANASDEYNTSKSLTTVGKPLGLHGVDPVAFIPLGGRVDGSAEYAQVRDGVAHYFSSAEKGAAFTENPNAHLPPNGGYCTLGVSVNKKFDGDPQYADIVNDKIYLF